MAQAKKLYPHQRTAFAYAIKQRHPALFMEMRLGKTLVTIRVINTYTPRDELLGLRVLVLAPNSAIGSWEDQLAEEGVPFVRLIGSGKKRRGVLDEEFNNAGAKWFLANKEIWQSAPGVADLPFDSVVLDESTFIKNPRAKVTKWAIKGFRDVLHRWILTGTPNPEGDHEYVCQMIFCNNYFYGLNCYWKFQAKLMEPALSGYGYDLIPWVRSKIAKEVGKDALVMRRKDVKLKEVRVRERRTVDFPPEMRKIYKTAEEEYALTIDGEESTTIWATGRYTWLRQLCGGVVDGVMQWKGKAKELLDLLTGELRHEKVVVWCMYNDEVELLHQMIKKAKIPSAYIWGRGMKQAEREKVRRAWERGRHRVLIVQQAVAQMGMNLSASDTLIYYSTPPGALARQQTEARTITIQKCKDGTPQLIIDIVVPNTVDEDVLLELQRKDSESDFSLTKALKERMRLRNG